MSLHRAVSRTFQCTNCRLARPRGLNPTPSLELLAARRPSRAANLTRPARYLSTTSAWQQPRSRGRRSREEDDFEPLIPGTNGVSTRQPVRRAVQEKEEEDIDLYAPVVKPASDNAPRHKSDRDDAQASEQAVEDVLSFVSKSFHETSSNQEPSQSTRPPSPSPPPPSDPNLPWYLQVSPPTRQITDNPLAARQQIPPLPPHPPPLLSTLLTHISNDLGLDDLSLLDLRNLDPPPALGSNLLMILGTARSEKHLHVSADRFCRYLRSEHSLSPYAAGLLGRNELKIKLRRKAKRMKMLANAGARQAEGGGNVDDGIRTGWICLTVGRIKAAEDAPRVERGEGFVGFGEGEEGVNVVVQMFVEGERGRMDLEGLWGKIEREDNNRRRNTVGEGIAVEDLVGGEEEDGSEEVEDALSGIESGLKENSLRRAVAS